MSPYSWPEALYGAIEEGIRGDALAVCVAHRGAHQFYLDGCHALPQQRPAFTQTRARCPEEGCRLAAETPHVHAPPTRIEVDVESLAEAIVRASRAAREERRPAPPPEARPAPPNTEREPAAQTSAPSIPTVTVWSPETGDGPGDR